jgi:hypothetical protein
MSDLEKDETEFWEELRRLRVAQILATIDLARIVLFGSGLSLDIQTFIDIEDLPSETKEKIRKLVRPTDDERAQRNQRKGPCACDPSTSLQSAPVDRSGEVYICLECWTTWDHIQHKASGRSVVPNLFAQLFLPRRQLNGRSPEVLTNPCPICNAEKGEFCRVNQEVAGDGSFAHEGRFASP